MPLNNGKTPVSRPAWLKDASSPATTSSSSPSPTTRTWQRKASIDTKKEETPDTPKKEVTAKLQSREIKVPLKVEKTIKPQSILKKPEPKPTEVKKEPEPKTLVIEKKPIAKLGTKSTSTTPSKSQSTTPSKSPTPLKTPPSSTPSKSPSKTPETYSDSDESDDEEEEEEETESEETETESESEQDDEEIDSDDFDFSDNEPYRPPSPVNSKQKLIIPALKKVKKTPESEPEERSKSPEFSFKKPELKKVVTKEKSEVRERSVSPEPKFLKPKLRKVPSSLRTKNLPSREKIPVVELKRAPSKLIDMEPKKSSEAFPLKPSVLRNESNKKIPLPPPPPPPPPPGLKPPPDFSKKPITPKHRDTIEKLKSRPRRRPDWSEMMKEVEEGKKLRHVQCNDRSSPIITCKSMTKVQGQYVFETEKKNTALDKLLSEIQSGVKLRPTKTNDRSRPVLDGLRKFRRQMTIEEQIQKSESKAVLDMESIQSPLPDDQDELDDIDRVRDDLQSTKQMLALELRNKEAQERENKRLLAKIALLEAELQQSRGGAAVAESSVALSNGSSDDVIVKKLKKETEEAQKTSKLLEKKYHDTAEQLDNAHKEMEEQKRYIANLEKKLNICEDRGYAFDEGESIDVSRRQSVAQQKESSPEMELVLSEEEEDETEEQKAERLARRLKREVDMLHTKLSKLKDKEMNARNERKSLRDGMKKNQQILRNEKKKFKKLQKEVEKMAAMMKAVEDECSDEEADEPEEPEEEEQEEESEPESEESESESESETESQSEDEGAEDQKKKENLERRVKRHDGRLSSLKKGNYLLEANVERLKDEIKDHKEKCTALQADLDSVIDLC